MGLKPSRSSSGSLSWCHNNVSDLLNDVNFFAECKLCRSFITVKRIGAFFCGLLLCILGHFAAAQTTIEGIVFDTHTQQRISQVYIYNTANDNGGYNNTRGEFAIDASPGDILIAAAKGYYPDTLIVSEKRVVLFHMARSTIWLDEVSVIVAVQSFVFGVRAIPGTVADAHPMFAAVLGDVLITKVPLADTGGMITLLL